MPAPRTKCISTKVTDAEYAAVARVASNQTLSVWARAVLSMAAVYERPPIAATGRTMAKNPRIPGNQAFDSRFHPEFAARNQPNSVKHLCIR